MEKDLTAIEKLRKKAEAKLKKIPAADSLSPKEVSELLHELQVHQEELEMQNQELREMQHRIEIVRDQYTDLFDFAPVGYFILDKKGIISNVNLTGCHLLGYERKGLKGKPFSVFITKRNGDAGNFYLFLKNIFNSANINSVELQLKNSKGIEFPVQMEGIIILDETGSPSLCRLTLRDISQEKRTALLEQLNEQLRLEKETARQYLEMSGVIFLAIDLNGTITMINQKGCELLGYKQIGHKKPGLPSEVTFRTPLGLNWFENFIPEKERIPVYEVFDRLKDDQPEMEYFENNILCLDGSQRTISWHNSVLRDASGKITGILGAGTDITIRKQEEIKLKKALAAQQESELRFRNIFENANDAITIIDAESFKILNANCKMMTRLGYTDNELFQLKIFDIYGIDSTETGKKYATELFDKKQLLFEAVQIRKDGVEVPVEVNSCLIEYGGRKAFLSISRDITERRKVEGLLMATLLEGQEKERQRIAGDLHDSIQPLLATIKRKLETLDPKVNAAIPEKAKDYKSVTLLLDKTLKEIRAIAHNLVPPALKDFGLVATLRDLCETMDQPGKLKVNFFSDGMDEKNESDNKMNFHVATGLYRIAQELLYNAVKHSKAKSITLQLVRHDKSCVLMIEDNGTGFKEPFKKKGLGMDSISARVKMMDGSLDIDSLEGRGTIITVEVPIPEYKN